ncbi:MAG: DUF835 domain-containing protein [Thermoplasmatota archaeon]
MDVFIVEDEEMIQQLYMDILSVRGYNLIGVASSGIEAVEMFRKLEKKPDLVILDHRMPGMGGLEAAALMREMDKETKIILVSADDNAVWEALKMGIVGMRKPFNIGELLSNIEASIPRKVKENGSGGVKFSGEPAIKRSGMYLINEEGGVKAIQLFRELLDSGYSGLAFTRKHPSSLRMNPGLGDLPVAWFTSIPNSDYPCISPVNIQKLLIMVQSAMSENSETAVLVLGFEYILTNIEFIRVINLLQVLNDRIMSHPHCVVIFSLDLDVLEERESKLFQKEFEMFIAKGDL